MQELHSGTVIGSADCGGGHRCDHDFNSKSHSFHSDLEYNSRFTLRISLASLGLGPWSRSRTVVGLSLSRKES